MHILEYLKDNETIGFYIEGKTKPRPARKPGLCFRINS